MFSDYEKRLCNDFYFLVLREDERFIEIQSKNTRHCWIIQKQTNSTNHKPVILYHKHHLKDPYYHKQYATLTVKHAIQIVKEHDAYILAQRQRQDACKS